MILLDNRLHQLIESYTEPVLPPDSEGNPIKWIEVTGLEQGKDWDYGDGCDPNACTPQDSIIRRPYPDDPNACVVWDSEACEFIVSFTETAPEEGE